MMSEVVYMFEAHTIQPFIFESGRLAEMVGASELIEELLDLPLAKTLSALSIVVNPDKDFIRKGGAAFFLKLADKESACRLRDAWSLVVAEHAPSLPFTHAVCLGENLDAALKQGREQLQLMRNQMVPNLPVAGPLLIRAPRTGNPAVALSSIKKNSQDWIDQASRAKRRKRHQKVEQLAKRFVDDPDVTLQSFAFPLNLDPGEDNAFPFISDNHYVAVIHVDGNGVGEELIKMSQSLRGDPGAATIFRQFSQRIKMATEGAAKQAVKAIFLQPNTEFASHLNGDGQVILPFRPLILGGDDLTVIVRADFALSFVQAYMNAFEEETERQLKKIGSAHVPKQLTACAGIAFVKVHQPFQQAYQLAESLCDFAKKRAREIGKNPIPSTLAMHRISSSFIADYETVLDEALTQKNSSDNRREFTLGAYGLGRYVSEEQLPLLGALLELKDLFQSMAVSKGPLRHFLTLLHAEPSDAEKGYRRWQQNVKEKWPEAYTQYCRLSEQLLGHLEDSSGALFRQSESGLEKTFIADLIDLIAVEGEAYDR